MLVAIASDDGIHVARDPGRCGGFVVFEVGTSSVVRVGYRSNAYSDERGAADAGQAGAPPRQYESLVAALSDCSALIATAASEALVGALRGSPITVHVCPGNSVDQAAEQFMKGSLDKARRETHRAGR